MAVANRRHAGGQEDGYVVGGIRPSDVTRRRVGGEIPNCGGRLALTSGPFPWFRPASLYGVSPLIYKLSD